MDQEANDWKPGDVLVVEGRNVNAPPRKGEVIKVLGEASHPHFEVRWDDGRETILYPAHDVTIRHAQRTHE